MTEAVFKALAEISDPEVIQDIVEKRGDIQHCPRSPEDGGTLTRLYNQYLDQRRNRSPTTISQYKRTIPTFIEFVARNRILYPERLTSTIINRYVSQLCEEYDADATILTYTKNVRAWLKWTDPQMEREEPIYGLLNRERLGLSPTARDEAIPQAEASHILRKLNQQRRGTALSALMELSFNEGPRLGGIHSLDVSDFSPAENDLYFRHRPTKGTRLKNGCEEDNRSGDGERTVDMRPRTASAIKRYLEKDRPDVTDEYGRKPLFATTEGRASKSTLRRWLYEATSCRWQSADIVDRECDGSCDPGSNVCAYSYYPHAVRRGAIVSYLSGGLALHKAEERFNVSAATIRKHYDPRTEKRMKEDRKEAVRQARPEI